MSEQPIEPGVDPTFFPDTEIAPDGRDLYLEEELTCVFCLRLPTQVPRMIINGAVNGGDIHSICSDCIEELGAVLRGREAYDAYHAERRCKYAEKRGGTSND
jgi:hypothetical protein